MIPVNDTHAPAGDAPPTSPPQAGQVRLDLFDASTLDRGRPRWVEAAWILVKCAFFAPSFPWPNRLKRFLLRRFGATIGKGVVIRPRVNIHFPWRFRVGDHCWIGDGCQILNIADVTFESHVALAHEVYVAAGSHDIRSATMKGDYRPILIKSGTWVASRAFVGPGVTIHENCVVGAAAVVMKDIGPAVVVAGNPARVIRPRVIDRP
jgi:putative colanic acid biosynthesis acetyltransferase WcaF